MAYFIQFVFMFCMQVYQLILSSKYGCFAIKDLWQPCLMDILAIVFPILVFCCDCWLDSGNSNKGFLPFLLMDVSWTLFCFYFYCVDKKSLCITRRNVVHFDPMFTTTMQLESKLTIFATIFILDLHVTLVANYSSCMCNFNGSGFKL